MTIFVRQPLVWTLCLLLCNLCFIAAWVVNPSPTTTASPRTRRADLFAASPDVGISTTFPKQSLNPFLAQIQPSPTVQIFSLVKQMEAEGVVVTSLCVGEPDFPPPQSVIDAIKSAVDAGQTTYTAVTGTAALRNAIAQDLQKRKSVQYNPATEIVVGNGAKQCVYQGLLALAGANDSVIVPAPYWPSYTEQVRLAGAEPIIIETEAEAGYLLTPTALRETLQDHPNVKVLILCHPSNPTGSVYSKQQLEDLCDVLQDFPAVSVLADEIYERLVYDGVKHVSVASMPGMRERTVMINGFSKSHAMTGLRLGYAAAPAHISNAISTIQSQLTSCAGSLSQAGGVGALQGTPDAWFKEVVQTMQHKRDFVLQELSKMPGVKVAKPPTGAFYVLPDVSQYCTGGRDDTALCVELLERQKLAVVPGSAFGAPGTIRLSYATSMEELQTAMRKLAAFFEEESKPFESRQQIII